jgi:tetratricopeptide (TPR) repeat protein
MKLLAPLLICASAFGAEQWTKIQTANFEIYTTASARRGIDAAQAFEQVRGLFVALKVSHPEKETPVRIIMFQNEREYAPYRPNELATAFYHPGTNYDYIVMSGLTSENYPAAVHEYVHVVIRHSGLKIPLAMNEGLADVYSTMKQVKGKVQIGSVLPGRLQLLQTTPLIPIPELLAVNQQSPLYNERNRASIFYAESWALMHMLLLSPEFSPKFGGFIELVQSDMDPLAALEKVTGRNARLLQNSLIEYISGNSFNAGVFDLKLEKLSAKPEVWPANSLDYGMVLGQILMDLRHTDEAKARFEEVARENPSSPLPEEQLGFLAWRMKDAEQARIHFAKAADLNSTNGLLYFNYAVLLTASDPRLIPALQKAVQYKPDLSEAHSFLADRYVAAGDYPHALEQLSFLKNGKPEERHAYFQRLSFVQVKLGQFTEARASAEQALATASTPKEKADSEGLLRFLANAR